MRALLVLGLLAFGASQLAAQKSTRFGIEGGGVYATVSGDDFTGTDAGVGFEAQVRNVGPRFTVGAGGAMTSHGVEGTSEKLSILSLFLEPRFNLSATGAFHPFIAGRAGMARQSMSATFMGTTYDMEATGTVFGGGAGFGYALSPKLHLNAVGTYNMMSFGDMKVDGNSQSGTSTSGSSVVVQVGLMFVLGG